MARYYFHFRNGILFEDEVGEEFADASCALRYAKRVARELAEDGQSDSSVIVAEGGCQLFEIPLSETEIDPAREKKHPGKMKLRDAPPVKRRGPPRLAKRRLPVPA